ncbi:tetratricopeptide repeat protein [Oceanomicrobium pacificus]|uniref:Tetratricopeptide repeat protein n=1 Tax=Oceanomicrobium pacificus TaxID=2692916 RepID=A0A6B0U2X2_9RHOB|nr:tetratricopeptide repeat protein [Oceanomicrobium pacificus]MXU65331.1 tetratricopeptide repeat protein [Oceanomicrobium pacificus]
MTARRIGPPLLLTACLLALPACEDTNRLSPITSGPNAPTGVARGQSVDPLIVGHRLMEAQEYELALQAYTRAIPEHGLNSEVLSSIGTANLKLGRASQASHYLRKALDQDDTFVPAWNNLGIALSALGEYYEAREAFRVAFALDNGATEDIRQNLIRAEDNIAALSRDEEIDSDFMLVRQGNGRYLLVSADE